MKTVKIAALAAFLCAGASLPALAAWDNIGSVNVSGGGRGRGMDRDVASFALGGPVERLQLRADRSDVDCSSVSARYGNGSNREIFRGRLRQGSTADINVPDGRISSLAFNCRAMDRRGDAVIHISADVGRYQQDWMRGPNWRTTWSRMFNWGGNNNNNNNMNNWRLVGTESFEGRRDSESAFTGWRGQNVDSVALKPLESDARCSRVTARFGNGRGQMLNVNNGDLLRRGMYYKLDLPGRGRDLTSLSLRCSAVGARQVSIQIFTGR